MEVLLEPFADVACRLKARSCGALEGKWASPAADFRHGYCDLPGVARRTALGGYERVKVHRQGEGWGLPRLAGLLDRGVQCSKRGWKNRCRTEPLTYPGELHLQHGGSRSYMLQ